MIHYKFFVYLIPQKMLISQSTKSTLLLRPERCNVHWFQNIWLTDKNKFYLENNRKIVDRSVRSILKQNMLKNNQLWSILKELSKTWHYHWDVLWWFYLVFSWLFTLRGGLKPILWKYLFCLFSIHNSWLVSKFLTTPNNRFYLFIN